MIMFLAIFSAILLFVGIKNILDLYYDKDGTRNSLTVMTTGTLLMLSGLVIGCISLSFSF